MLLRISVTPGRTSQVSLPTTTSPVSIHGPAGWSAVAAPMTRHGSPGRSTT